MRVKFIPFILIFMVVGTVMFQNCSNISLTKVAPSVVLENSIMELPIPRKINGNSRIVLVLDQSFSMVWDKCPTDLDGDSPDPQTSSFTACDRNAGVDQPGYRYQVIDKWLDELDGMADANTKVMILPFSGGKAARPRLGNPVSAIHGLTDLDNMKFLPIADARAWLTALKQEQEAMIENGSREIMGTTVYTPIINYARGEIQTEIATLVDKGELSTTPFEFVMLTDGVYKPTTKLFNILRTVAGCPSCDQDPTHVACTCFSNTCWSGGTPPGSYCQNLERNFRQYFGDPDENQLNRVVESLQSIRDLQYRSENSGFKINMKFVKVNWTGVPQDDLNTNSNKTKNIFDEIQSTLGLPVYNISSGEIPFSILAGGGDAHTYVLQNLYAINANVFVDKFGSLIVDSDGDGLSDDEEIEKSLDPTNPRSNGKCLDYITANYGCQTISCNSQIDSDKDGLNECEEATLGTKYYLFDSDQDHIPDIFEAIRGLNPNLNDSGLFSAGDKHSDHDHFRAGVVSNMPLDYLNEYYKVRLETRFEGYKVTQDSNGVSQAVGMYKISLANMPLLQSLEVPSKNIISTKEGLNSNAIPLSQRMDPTAKLANYNQIIFLMQITTLENPNKISWHIYRRNIRSDKKMTKVELEGFLQFNNFVQVQGSL